MIPLVTSFSLATYKPINQDIGNELLLSISLGTTILTPKFVDNKLIKSFSCADAYSENKAVDMFSTIVSDS